VLCLQADYVVNVVGVGGITSVGLYQVSSIPLACTVACHTMFRAQIASWMSLQSDITRPAWHYAKFDYLLICASLCSASHASYTDCPGQLVDMLCKIISLWQSVTPGVEKALCCLQAPIASNGELVSSLYISIIHQASSQFFAWVSEHKTMHSDGRKTFTFT